MVRKKIENEILSALIDTGLNNEESIIYYTLLKYGQKGTTVRKLNLELKQIERTTIYHILERLIKKEYVIAMESTETLKKAKIFIGLEPSIFFNKLLNQKKKEYQTFEKKAPLFLERLQQIYELEEEYSIQNIDPFIQPYLSQLLKSGWKVSNQIVEKNSKIFGYDFYEYHVDPPSTGPYTGYGGFHIYVFDHILEISTENKKEVDLDKSILLNGKIKESFLKKSLLFPYFNTELKFVVMQIKRIVKDRFFDEFKIRNVMITESEITLLGITFSSLIVKIKSEKDTEFREAFKSVLLPTENKCYFIWAVKPKVILKMLKSVLRLENILFSE
ncbi:MAG: helix-turn-helix domain-containing protein [Promethearchaeota archaeon]